MQAEQVEERKQAPLNERSGEKHRSSGGENIFE